MIADDDRQWWVMMWNGGRWMVDDGHSDSGYKPIIKHAIAAARHVPTKIAPWSIPVKDIIWGFTKIIYAIVTNVVNPANNSELISVLCSDNLKNLSSDDFIISSICY